MYYRGDYTRGGYYRGDPFLGALIGGVARSVGLGKVAAKAGRWLAGRITGSSVKRATQVIGGTVAGAVATTVANRVLAPSPTITMENIEPLDMGGGEVMGGGGGTQVVMTASGRRMRVRWSSSKGKWVAVRTMNPLNPKALKRSLRRAEGFEKFARRTMNALFKTSGGTKVRKFKRKTTRS